MDFSRFIKILKKHRYGIIAIPLLVMLITFMLTRKLADSYISRAKISAGIVDGSQKLVLNKDLLVESRVTQAFTNLTQMMQLEVTYDQVSYLLMIHDLTSSNTFRPPSKLVKQLNDEARRHAVAVYTQLYNAHQPLSPTDPDQQGLAKVLKSMGYNWEAIKGKLVTYRVNNSDFIELEYESDNPDLSAFVVNNFCKEFILYYTSVNRSNEIKAISFLADLIQEKKDSLDERMSKLKDFKIKNGVLNLNEQAKSLYSQVAEFRMRLHIAEEEVAANKGAIASIDEKFTGHERDYLESKVSQINSDIVEEEQLLNDVNLQYIKNDFNDVYKYRIDSLKEDIYKKIMESSDRYILSPATTKENLIAQRLKLEIDMQLAKNSIRSYQTVLDTLNKQLALMVPNEAVIQDYEQEVTVASQEYLDALAKYNQSSMEFNTATRLKQIEYAMPGEKQPSKKIVLVVLAGILSFVLYLLLLFVLFYLDGTLKTPQDLADRTDAKVLGYLPVIYTPTIDIQKLWGDQRIGDPDMGQPGKRGLFGARRDNGINHEDLFKSALRATRFEIGMAMSGARNLVITSLAPGAGKTLFSLCLASAYNLINKRVLLIDGNFGNPGITSIIKPRYFIEDYLRGNIAIYTFDQGDNITVLGNHGIDQWLFEIQNQEEIEQKLLELKNDFDMVLIEAPAINAPNQAKEWIAACSRVMTVFEANTNLTKEMKNSMEFLQSFGDKYIGSVINKVTEVK
jgi:polysaccharide biosynthesis transport protein